LPHCYLVLPETLPHVALPRGKRLSCRPADPIERAHRSRRHVAHHHGDVSRPAPSRWSSTPPTSTTWPPPRTRRPLPPASAQRLTRHRQGRPHLPPPVESGWPVRPPPGPERDGPVHRRHGGALGAAVAK